MPGVAAFWIARQLRGMNSMLFRTAAALCFLAVALGAFGAHALKDTLQANAMSEVWDKAVLYHFIHAFGNRAGGDPFHESRRSGALCRWHCSV